MPVSRVASRFAGIEKSPTYAILDLASELRAQGESILDLNGGEPDFDTPSHITAEATQTLNSGFTHYTPSRGLPALLTAIGDKLLKDNGVAVDPARQIIVTPSAKHALFLSVMTLLGPGDELLIPTPSWVSYPAMVRLAAAEPVFAPLSADNGFRITRELLEERLTPRTRALLINNPNNPTGNVLTTAEAEAVADVARDHDLFVITDEIYEKVRFRGEHVSIAALPGMADRTVTVNGFSKGYAMTGWRLGYVAAPEDVSAQMLKVQQHTVGCAGSFVQRGGISALTGPQEPIDRMRTAYESRRDLLVEGLSSIPGFVCPSPDAALYAFCDISGTGFADPTAFTTWLLREAKVAATPGSAFGPGGERHIRMAFATDEETLGEAVDRIKRAMARQ
ncbi:pyridoxal phosphate-dependent aminotransferase [Streptomyces luteolus]|uniref:Aminotransferase n=1 Tax=Streptomyces luteolus TaxID=3043615 RepID=A0ABT6SR19_9ACTN|nr:pyridoxal phosphate-dependent aminotransferase [Streptomyces sp. B-S-A12]MDI3417841.1 pyridoxal phosphate-dependent aminotransferase [Streptomyces sp. B-S-A12]